MSNSKEPSTFNLQHSTFNLQHSTVNLQPSTVNRLVAVLVLFAVLTLPSTRADAQLLQVKQTVFGMDCAPCAYGLEKRLKNLDGVTEAQVSLNEGLATTEMTTQSRLKLSMIREAIRESGFSAEDAVIRARGTLKQEDGRWIFEVPGGEHFAVEQPPGDQPTKQGFEQGRVVLSGRVAKGEPDEHGGYKLQILTAGTP